MSQRVKLIQSDTDHISIDTDLGQMIDEMNDIFSDEQESEESQESQPESEKLSSLIEQITNAVNINDIDPIIYRLNAFNDIKKLLLNKINELSLLNINNLYYRSTSIEHIFDKNIICNIIIYLSQSSMYRKLPILNKYFNNLMKTEYIIFNQYTVNIPYTIYTKKTTKLYGKIIHETNTIEIYTNSDYTNINLEFEINDINDLNDNIPLKIWSNIPKWNFQINKNIETNDKKNDIKKTNEMLIKILEKASSSIKSIIINKGNENIIISQNDINIHLISSLDNLYYLQASNNFILTFLDFSNECTYILANLLCIDFINIEENMINVINNNLRKLLILRLRFQDKNDDQTQKYHIKLPQTLEFIEINGFDFNSTTYLLDFSNCHNIICIKFYNSTIIRKELFDNIIINAIQQRIIWNESILIQCFIIDEIDNEYNSCWFRYFSSFSFKNNHFFSSNIPKIKYLKYMNHKTISIVNNHHNHNRYNKQKNIVENNRTSKLHQIITTSSPILKKYNDSLSIHNDDHNHDDPYYNPFDHDNIKLINIKHILSNTYPLYSILSNDHSNDNLLWKLLLENKYKFNYKHFKQKLQIYQQLHSMNIIKWIKTLGHKKPFLPFVNFSIPNKYSDDDDDDK